MSVQTLSPSPARLVAVCGARAQIHPLVLQSLCVRAARGEQLALVVGDNHFDAYQLARLARARGFHPASVLARIALTRPFTCYQLHHSIAALDPKGFCNNVETMRRVTRQNTRGRCARVENPSGLDAGLDALYVIGLLELFYDQDVREYEAQRLLLATLKELKRLAAKGLPVLVTFSRTRCAREAFMAMVRRTADVYKTWKGGDE